jgi:citrate synthase
LAEGKRGLEGVIVGDTSISKVFGDEGNLVYRGIGIRDLAEHACFEEVLSLLWSGSLPRQAELQELTERLAAERQVPAAILDWIRGAPEEDAMATLRTAVSALSAFDVDAEDSSLLAVQRKALRLVASMGTLVAAIGRAREGKEFLPPHPEWSTAANFLFMLNGHEPDPAAVRILDRALVLHADHGFNASTFAARVTTSTLSDMHSAVVAAIATLKGASHGGANARVMQMLLEIAGSATTAEVWVRQQLEAGRRIMGFGHRVYKVEDPRATHLRRDAETLSRSYGDAQWFSLSRRIEQVMKQEKGLFPNVDFYSASTYYLLGIPLHLYTPLFAMSRIAGWTAHILEQMQDNRLIRPRSHYTGPKQVDYVPLSQR